MPGIVRATQTKKANLEDSPLGILAEWTGLEPATPGVTGRYSNQLNYHSSAALPRFPIAQPLLLRPVREIGKRPKPCGPSVLLVGADGLEPPTFAL